MINYLLKSSFYISCPFSSQYCDLLGATVKELCALLSWVEVWHLLQLLPSRCKICIYTSVNIPLSANKAQQKPGFTSSLEKQENKTKWRSSFKAHKNMRFLHLGEASFKLCSHPKLVPECGVMCDLPDALQISRAPLFCLSVLPGCAVQLCHDLPFYFQTNKINKAGSR